MAIGCKIIQCVENVLPRVLCLRLWNRFLHARSLTPFKTIRDVGVASSCFSYHFRHSPSISAAWLLVMLLSVETSSSSSSEDSGCAVCETC